MQFIAQSVGVELVIMHKDLLMGYVVNLYVCRCVSLHLCLVTNRVIYHFAFKHLSLS